MVQITSNGYNSVVNSSYRVLNTGVLISFPKTVASGINYFTINVSTINGLDIIRGDGGSTNPSFFDKYQYTDYTPQTKNWSVQRDIGQFPFGLIMAQADVELDNSSKMFLPGYDATIGSGILPGRPFKISAGIGQDSLLQFTGFAGQPELSITNRNMIMHGYDVMDYLNNYTFSSASGTAFLGSLTNVTTASAIGYYLGKLGFNSNQMALDRSLVGNLYYINVTDRKFGSVLQDLMYAEQGMLFADENGKINFWNRQHFNTTSGLGSQFNISYNNAISVNYSNAPIINDVTVISKPRAVSHIAKVYSLTATDTILGNSTLTKFINFSDANGALYVDTINTPVYSATPIVTSYYTVDTSVVSTAASDITISSTYLFGTSYKIVFSNSNSKSIQLTDLQLFGYPALVVDSISENYCDQTSVETYGRNPSNNGASLIINNDYIQSASDALSLGYDIVTRYSSPNKHYDVEIFSNPALQIGDFGTLDPDGRGTQNVWITGKTDKLSPGGALTQMLKLEQRTIYNYVTINVSIVGGGDRIAP